MNNTFYFETIDPEQNHKLLSYEFDDSDPSMEEVLDRAINEIFDNALIGSKISIFDQNPNPNKQDNPKWYNSHCIYSLTKDKS